MRSPIKPAARLRQGLQQIALRNYESVHAQALDMVKANVHDAVPFCLLATIAAEHGNHVKACELFERAAELEPQNPWFQVFYGKALTTLGYQSRAKTAADNAANYDIDDAIILDTLGVIYSRTGFHEKAVPFFTRAAALNPEPANFHFNLAASQQFLGNFDKARAALTETLERDPNAYRAWSSLVGLQRQSKDDNHLPVLKKLFDEFADDADGRLHLGHAIAKTLEDLGQYEESLGWLHAAKRDKKQPSDTDFVSYESLFRAAKKTVAADSPSSDEGADDAPIFIVGLPRTGTTLVDRILSSHTQVTAAGELNVFPGLVKEAARTPSNLVLDRETLMQANEMDLSKIGRAYVDDTLELARGAARITDKMPLNFFYAGLIHRALPGAKIIALRRGAMDSCLSNYRQLLTVQQSYYHYTYDLQEIAKFYTLFDDLMSHWRERIPPDRFMEVRYEDIVLDQETQTRKLLNFCGLGWEESCLRFHENSAPVSTASSVQVRQPLYSSSINRWKRYGDELKVLQDALGYLANQ